MLIKRKQAIARFTGVLAMAVLSTASYAFQPLVTDDTGTQGAGGKQIEFSLNADRSQAAGNSEHMQVIPVVFTRGLTEALDVYASLSHDRKRAAGSAGVANGNGNPAFGAKWRWFENESSKTSLALKPEVVLPVSAGREAARLGTGKTSGALTLILTQELAFGAIHINAGVARKRYRDASGNPDCASARASIAPVWDASDNWKLALDLGTESARAAGTTVRSNFLELGAIYAASKDLDIALGILRSSDNDQPSTTTHTASAGLTWRFH